MRDIRSVGIEELVEGMLVMEPVLTGEGVPLRTRGQTITRAALKLIKNSGTFLEVEESL